MTAYMWLDGFMIDNDTLKNVAVFDGGDDLDECGLEINYVISDWYYTTNGEGWDWLFEYDAKARDLYIPIVTYVDETIPVISYRYRLYHFNGEEFVEKGDVPHKNLHQSLSDYVRFVCYFRAKDYIATEDEIHRERERFALRLKNCIEAYSLEEIPARMKSLDDTQSELTRFNYSNLYYYE